MQQWKRMNQCYILTIQINHCLNIHTMCNGTSHAQRSTYLYQFSIVVEAVYTNLAAHNGTHLLSQSCVGHKCTHNSAGSSAHHLPTLQSRCLLGWLLICSFGFSSSSFWLLAEFSSQWCSTWGPFSCWLSDGGRSQLLEACSQAFTIRQFTSMESAGLCLSHASNV